MKSSSLIALRSSLKGDLYTDEVMRILYATDASVYREIPLAVARPKDTDDIKKLIEFATKEKTSLIPRAAGTSLAGQCVGNGIVVDISKYFTEILEINEKEKWVRVQPGVILTELNKELEKYGLLFGPETSTANRCMLGGMVGNNSCGLHSYVYGSTREHTLEIKAILSDGSEALFKPLTVEEFNVKTKGNTLENKIYRHIRNTLNNEYNCKEIQNEFPASTIPRRNTGYALDLLLNDFKDLISETSQVSKTCEVFKNNAFNICKLICGSEGTLAFITEIKLNLVLLSSNMKALLCVHLNSVEEAMYANLIALKYNPNSIELADKVILDLTKENIEQKKNRFFIQGDPGAVLIIEIEAENKIEIENIAEKIKSDMLAAGYGFHFPLIYGSDMSRVWNLRNAGLGILTNMPGDAKPVAVIEDTAVDVNYLPQYYKDFQLILKELNLESTYYAHIGTGEIHIRPIIDLKTEDGVKLFREIGRRTAELVKKYKGSLSGEHGDGRLRGEFIRLMLGEHIYKLFCELKQTWDPDNIFNPGKIVNTPPMNTFLRYSPQSTVLSQQSNSFNRLKTILDYSDTLGFLRAIDKCNGTAECRKGKTVGGTMCPSYMATKDEIHSTRARANILREFITGNNQNLAGFQNLRGLIESNDVLKVLDLCLSCKGCKSECPSNIDMASYKAEFLQQYYDSHRIPLRTKLFAYITQINKIALSFTGFYNAGLKNKLTGNIIKNISGISLKRNLPALYKFTLTSWANKNLNTLSLRERVRVRASNNLKSKVYLYIDEFTNYNDVEIGIKAIKLLSKLGYDVQLTGCRESGRTFISKGLLKKAKVIAENNVRFYKDKISESIPLIGIEPSAILTFRDEYLRLVDKDLKTDALNLSKNCYLIDEFLANEIDKGNIIKFKIQNLKFEILLHGHCHQKVLASIEPTKKLLSLIPNYDVKVIPSGCCGMAGSFGYEKEHYEVSMKIGELVLFPHIREQSTQNTIIAAPGTSCRQQIMDGTGRKAFHPIEILYDAISEE